MKTILVPVGGSDSDWVVFDTALAVARPLAAHLAFLHVDVGPGQASLNTPHVEFARGAALRHALLDLTEQCEGRSRAARNNVRAFCQRSNIDMVEAPRASTVVTAHLRTEEGDAVHRLLFHARHNDLLVMGRATRADGLPHTRLETLLMKSGRPLIVASSTAAKPLLNTVMVCWNETPSAARAVSAAMPILTKAKRVVVASVNEATSDTVAAVSETVGQLRWHGIEVASRTASLNGLSTADRLFSLARECGASLLVMGGYGRRRTWEALFGGCTLAALEANEFPVFLLH